MARTFKQRDVTAAVKAVVAAGVEVQRVEVDHDGKIVIVTAARTMLEPISDFDKWKFGHAD